MQIQGSDIRMHLDPLSYTGGIRALSGSITQTFDKTQGGYSPDRGVLPCVLMPWIASIDLANEDKDYTKELPLASVEWYVVANNGSKTSVLSPNGSAEQEIYSVSADGYTDAYTGVTYPKHACVVKKNVTAGDQLILLARITVSDPQDFQPKVYEYDIVFTSQTSSGASFGIRPLTESVGDMTVDSVMFSRKDEPTETIGAQLMMNGKDCEDSHAAYQWEIRIGNKWEKLTPAANQLETENKYPWLRTSFVGNVLPKNLQIDCSFADELKLRCKAVYYETEKPADINSGSKGWDETMIVYFSRRYGTPKTSLGEVQGVEGSHLIKSTNRIKRKFVIKAHGGDLSEQEMKDNYIWTWQIKYSDGRKADLGNDVDVSGTVDGFGISNRVSALVGPDESRMVERKCYKSIELSSSQSVIADSNGNIIFLRQQ